MTDLTAKRLLLVEDNDDLRMLIGDLLEFEGAVVERCFDVASALRVLADNPCDLAMLDITLGNELCWPVADKARELGVPYLLVSGYGDMYEHMAPDAVHLPKPYTFDQLLDAIATTLGKR